MTWPAKPPPSAQHDRPLDSHNRRAGAGGVFEDGAMTTDDLTALQALRAKMTPTPWDWSRTALEPSALAWSIQPGVLIADGNDGTPGGDEIDRANALGIVALVNSADALITEVLALRAENERLRNAELVDTVEDSTEKASFKALAECVMSLSDPDSSVNADIAYAIGWRTCNGEWYSASIVRFAKEKVIPLIDIEGVDECPDFTGSLNDSVRLVNRRWRWEAQSDGPARVIVPNENKGPSYYDADGATPALALTAAALLALAEQVQQ